ncbi:MAG: 50S ribosomal protein L34e [Candidatus Woesearchaeota archaeon]
MSQRKFNSNRFRKVKVKLSKGTKIHYRLKKPNKLTCSNCGSLLSGTLRKSSRSLSGIAKSKKVPSRGFGGELCSECSKRVYMYRARNLN